MSDYYDGDENDSELVSDLRKRADKASKRADALEKELASLRSESRVSSVKDKVTARGLDPRIAAIIPSDVEDLDSWLDTYGDLFGAKAPEAGEDAGAEIDGELAALEQQSGTEADAGDDNGILARIAATSSFDELAKLIASSN